MDNEFYPDSCIDDMVARINDVYHKTVGDTALNMVGKSITIGEKIYDGTTVLSITNGTVIAWHPGEHLSPEQADWIYSAITGRHRPSCYRPYTYSQYEAAMDKAEFVAESLITGSFNGNYGRINGAELPKDSTYARIDFNDQIGTFDIRALRIVLGSGFGHVAQFNGGDIVVVPEGNMGKNNIGPLAIYMIPFPEAPTDAPVVSVHC